MYTLIVFTSLCLVQFLFIWIKWSEIRDYTQVYGELTDLTGVSRNKIYMKVLITFGYLWHNFKKLLIIPLFLITFANFVVSLIIGGILSLIF